MSRNFIPFNRTSAKLIVFLQNPTLTVWLSNMAARYPQQTFGFEEMDARTYLGQIWEIAIPDYVTDDDILQSDLLGTGIIPRAGDTFENVILDYFYDSVFTAAAFSSALLEEIVLAYDQGQWEANASNALVLRVYQQRLKEWRDKTKDRAIRTVLDMVKDDLTGLKSALMKYKVLRAYPTIGERLLGNRFTLFQAINPSLDSMEILDAHIPDVIQQVEYALNALNVPENEEDALQYLQHISGVLVVEFDHIEALLNSHLHLLTNRMIEKTTRGLSASSPSYPSSSSPPGIPHRTTTSSTSGSVVVIHRDAEMGRRILLAVFCLG